MDVPQSPDRVFDFPMAEPEPHPTYDFFAAEPIPGLAEAPGNMNGWIEEDVPLLGEMGEPMEMADGVEEAELDLLFGDDTEDDEDEGDWENDDEWLMAIVTPPRATVTLSSTYEVGGPSSTTPKTLFPARQPFPGMTHGNSVPPSVIDDLCVRMGNLEYGHGTLVKKIGTVSDAKVADSISIREIWPRVTTVEGQVQVMVSQAVHVVSRLEEIKTRVQQVESRVDTHPSDHMTVQGQETRLAEMESRESTLMSYMLWMEERLAVLEKKLPELPPGPQ
ncbi:hypothetical protein Tco_0532245 [Tanacetum coccineum]